VRASKRDAGAWRYLYHEVGVQRTGDTRENGKARHGSPGLKARHCGLGEARLRQPVLHAVCREEQGYLLGHSGSFELCGDLGIAQFFRCDLIGGLQVRELRHRHRSSICDSRRSAARLKLANRPHPSLGDNIHVMAT